MEGIKEIKAICWWSGGVASAVACGITIKKYGAENCYLAFCDTGIESDDTYRFMVDFESKFDVKIHKHKSGRFNEPEDVWRKYKGLNFATGAPCSKELKVRVREEIEKNIYYDLQIFGFDYCKKEIKRAANLKQNHPHTNPRFPLIEAKITRSDLFKILKSWELSPPKAYDNFLNNNCLGGEYSEKGGCIQGGAGYWEKIKAVYPKKFEYMAKIEHELSEIKGEPVTICMDQKNNTKTKVFLKKNPKFPDVKDIDSIKGKQPIAPMECNGLCSLDDPGSQLALDIFDEHLSEIKNLIIKAGL